MVSHLHFETVSWDVQYHPMIAEVISFWLGAPCLVSPREKTKGSQVWAGFGVPQAKLEEGTLKTEV